MQGEFEQLITSLLSENNAIRENAEKAFEQASQQPDQLLQQLCSAMTESQDKQVRFFCELALFSDFLCSAGEVDLRRSVPSLCVQHAGRRKVALASNPARVACFLQERLAAWSFIGAGSQCSPKDLPLGCRSWSVFPQDEYAQCFCAFLHTKYPSFRRVVG